MIVKHPTLRTVQRDVPEGDLDRWLAAGWLPLLDEAQTARLAEIELEVELGCPTCGASGDDPCVTPSGSPARREHAGRRTSEAATAADQGQHSDEGDM